MASARPNHRQTEGEACVPEATANGITIHYEEHGDPSHPAMLLVMGLGAQMTL